MEISIDDKQGYTLVSLVDRVAGKNVGMEKFIAAGSKCRLVKVTRDIGTSFAKRPDKQRRVRFVRRACSSPLNLPGISHLRSSHLRITNYSEDSRHCHVFPRFPSSSSRRRLNGLVTETDTDIFPFSRFHLFSSTCSNKFGAESRILMVGTWVRMKIEYVHET